MHSNRPGTTPANPIPKLPNRMHVRRSAFFYGTLMAPSVLRRVTNRNNLVDPSEKPPLRIRPALLPGFRRHRVRYCDYPAIVPAIVHPGSADPSATPQASPEVRGTYVYGLTDECIRRLDAFEGSQYERRFVRVRLLPGEDDTGKGRLGVMSADGDAAGGPQMQTQTPRNPSPGEEEWSLAETYVWTADVDDLEDREWDFDEFCRDRLWIWDGGEGDEGFQAAANVGTENENGNEDVVMEADVALDPTGGRSFSGGQFERRMRETDG